jgi:hypothetical protein
MGQGGVKGGGKGTAEITSSGSDTPAKGKEYNLSKVYRANLSLSPLICPICRLRMKILSMVISPH